MGGEPAEIEALKARAGAGGARAVFAGKRPPAELASFLALADVRRLPAAPGREHAVQGLHVPGLGEAAGGHAAEDAYPTPG